MEPFPERVPPWMPIGVDDWSAPPFRIVLPAVCVYPPVNPSVAASACTVPEF